MEVLTAAIILFIQIKKEALLGHALLVAMRRHKLGTKCQLEPSVRISWLQSFGVSWVSLYLRKYVQYLR